MYLLQGDIMETKDINTDAYTILESDEFDVLLDAVELMAKAQGNLLSFATVCRRIKNYDG